MSNWSFYNDSTGLFFPSRFSASNPAAVADNTPVGHSPIPGHYDHLSQRVDVSVQPPPPPDPPVPPVPQEVERFDPVTGTTYIELVYPEPEVWYPPVIDYIPPAPADDQWQTWAWDSGIKRWVATPTLLAVKRDARQRMTEAWNIAKTAGVTFGTKTAPTDADSWTRYLAIKEMAADGGWVDVPIPLADGTFEMMTQAKMVTLWGALKSMERTLLARLRDRVDAINAATTKEEVDAVVW
jgi:hypothetical protein